MRWRRRRFASGTVTKKHYLHNGAEIASCKKEYDSRLTTTNVPGLVTCKNCIKRMLKEGHATLDQIPTYLQPAETTTTAGRTSDKLDVDDFKSDYLKRLGVFK